MNPTVITKPPHTTFWKSSQHQSSGSPPDRVICLLHSSCSYKTVVLIKICPLYTLISDTLRYALTAVPNAPLLSPKYILNHAYYKYTSYLEQESMLNIDFIDDFCEKQAKSIHDKVVIYVLRAEYDFYGPLWSLSMFCCKIFSTVFLLINFSLN